MAIRTQPDARELDPLFFVSGWRLVLEELEEACGCAAPGCTSLAAPDGPAFVGGRGDRGMAVRLRRLRCTAGHWCHREVR